MSKEKTTREKVYGTEQKRRNISLDDKRAKKLEKLGGGKNLSEGIRIACDAYQVK